MTENVMRKCDLFVANKNQIHKNFKWDYQLMSVLSGMVFTTENIEADIDSMKNCLKILKKNTGVFSTLRSTERLFLVSKMTLAEDPEKYLKNVKTLYDKIKKGHICKDSYMVVAAINIVDAGRVSEADQIIVKFKDIMKLMKKEHPILTGDEDMPMAISLAMTDKTPEEIVTEMEESYQVLKKELKASSNSFCLGLFIIMQTLLVTLLLVAPLFFITELFCLA